MDVSKSQGLNLILPTSDPGIRVPGIVQLVGNHLPVAVVGGMTTKRPRAVPSKQWSCSELKEGQAKLLAVKNEVEDDLALKIQEPTHGCYMYHV